MYGRVGLPKAGRRLDPRVADVIVGITLCAGMCVIGALYRPVGWRPFDLWTYVLTALICLPLTVRRSVPVAVLIVTSAAYAWYLSTGHFPGLNLWAPALACYTVAAVRPARVTVVAALITAAVMFYSGVSVPEMPVLVAVAQAVAAPAVACTLGGLSRQLGDRNRELARTTDLLRHEQAQRTRRALVEERVRIARELHDVVAHHMSVISMHAGVASYVFDTDPPKARAAVDTIGDAGREALEEMRRMLNLLRTSDAAPPANSAAAPPEPVPGLDELPALLDRVRAAGVEVRLEIADTVAALPNGLQLAAYRVVQEALTNVIKHAAPCRATVFVRHDARRLLVIISNDSSAGLARADAGHAAGLGLIGVRERARIYGGTVTTANWPDGGFAVVLTLPTGQR